MKFITDPIDLLSKTVANVISKHVDSFIDSLDLWLINHTTVNS